MLAISVVEGGVVHAMSVVDSMMMLHFRAINCKRLISQNPCHTRLTYITRI